jgi:hypothetical protein
MTSPISFKFPQASAAAAKAGRGECTEGRGDFGGPAHYSDEKSGQNSGPAPISTWGGPGVARGGGPGGGRLARSLTRAGRWGRRLIGQHAMGSRARPPLAPTSAQHPCNNSNARCWARASTLAGPVRRRGRAPGPPEPAPALSPANPILRPRLRVAALCCCPGSHHRVTQTLSLSPVRTAAVS